MHIPDINTGLIDTASFLRSQECPSVGTRGTMLVETSMRALPPQVALQSRAVRVSLSHAVDSSLFLGAALVAALDFIFDVALRSDQDPLREDV